MTSNRTFTSLRHRLIWPFALMGFSISAALSTITYLITSTLEDRNIRQTLIIELESFKTRKKQNAAALPINAQLIQSYFLPEPDHPELNELESQLDSRITDEPLIVDLVLDKRIRTVVVERIDNQILAIVYDCTGSIQMLSRLAWLLLGATGFMTVLSTALGYRLAGQVVRPISQLLVEIAERTKLRSSHYAHNPFFASGNYPSNEIGRLALALDNYASQLHGFVQRERHFSSDVSHELRTPIAIIRGAADVACELPDVSPALMDKISLIRRKAARLADLLDALLILGREQEYGLHADQDASCAISEVLEDAIGECLLLIATKPVSISSDIISRPLVRAERSMAYVVISNILRNACIHTQKGHVRVVLSEQNLVIEDTGGGIPDDRFQNIFDRFTKGEQSSGTGLGLSIVARMIKVMNWRIEISSIKNKGTCVVLNFASEQRIE